MPIDLDDRYQLNPAVSLRPEPFGALAYHFGNRRLSFLRHPDMVAVVSALGDHESVRATLVACGVDERRWPSFRSGLTTLLESDMLVAVTDHAMVNSK